MTYDIHDFTGPYLYSQYGAIDIWSLEYRYCSTQVVLLVLE